MKSFLAFVLVLGSVPAFASTGIECGKEILTPTGTTYELATGGDNDKPQGALSKAETDWSLTVAGSEVKDGAIVKTEDEKDGLTITVTHSFTVDDHSIVRTYVFSKIGESTCDQEMSIPATVSEAIVGKAPKVIATLSCKCGID